MKIMNEEKKDFFITCNEIIESYNQISSSDYEIICRMAADIIKLEKIILENNIKKDKYKIISGNPYCSYCGAAFIHGNNGK